MISQLADQNKSHSNEKDKDNSFEIDESLVISNQTNLLKEYYFFKNLTSKLERIKADRKKRYLELKSREESLAEQLDETFYSLSNSKLNVFNLKVENNK